MTGLPELLTEILIKKIGYTFCDLRLPIDLKNTHGLNVTGLL